MASCPLGVHGTWYPEIIHYEPIGYTENLDTFRFWELPSNCRGLGPATCKLCRKHDEHSITLEQSVQPTVKYRIRIYERRQLTGF